MDKLKTMEKVELNHDFVTRFEKAQLQLVKLVWLPSVFNSKNTDLRNILNSFDSEKQFRIVVPQIPLSQEVRLYDMDFMMEVFAKHHIYGFFAECKVPVRYDFKEGKKGMEFKSTFNPSYILLGYANTLEELVNVLEKGSIEYMEQDMNVQRYHKNALNDTN